MKQDNLLGGLSVLADVLGLTAVLLWLPVLVDWLMERSVVNVIALTVVYLLFCTAVYIIRKLQPQIENGPLPIPAWLLNQKVMAVLAVIFGLTLTILILDQLGYWESALLVDDREMGAGESSAFFVYAPGAFLAIAFFYILVLSGKTRETILLAERRYLPMALFGLLGANGMLWLLAGVLRALLLENGGGSVATAVAAFLALTLLFAPPRIWYLSKRPSWGPLLTFIPLLLITAWFVSN